ncbi:MAG: hypothetical protein WCX64_04485 [Candidatus Micrarchaeia archaeon]
MSRKSVDALFDALYALTDLRVIFRQSAPKHELSAEQKKEAKAALDAAKKAIKTIEDELKL